MVRPQSNAKPCLACGELSSFPQTFVETRGWRYVRCPGCGLVYLDPKPKAEDLRRFYNTAYQYDFEVYRRGARRTETWLASLETFCPPPRHLLEVGCSFGFLLEVARRRGWQVSGVELGAYSAEYARERLQLPVVTGSVFDLPCDQEGSYSAVVAWHLLEHEPDPVSFLKRVRLLMRSGGILSLRVPNMQSLVARLAGPCWQWLSPPEHIYLFTPRALVRLVLSSGFEVVFVGSARGPAHNPCFEVLRARAKQALGFTRNRVNGCQAAYRFERSAVYEKQWWYRSVHRILEAWTSPLYRSLSPWLSRHLLEAEIVLFARKRLVADQCQARGRTSCDRVNSPPPASTK